MKPMNSKPDDRRDNVEKIQKHISDTIENMEAAEETMAETSDAKGKAEISQKNDRRREALKGMRHEIRDEANDRKKDYQS